MDESRRARPDELRFFAGALRLAQVPGRLGLLAPARYMTLTTV
ncbi:MAG: hypothetical protein ACOCY8_03655 [Spirochaetota bacterium]